MGLKGLRGSPDFRIILIPGLPALREGQWLFLEFVPDYSSGGCVRFSRTSTPSKPENSIVKEQIRF